MMINVGGAEFSHTKKIQCAEANDTKTTTLVAKGKSYLSYFYVGVCSSVLYLAKDSIATDNSVLHPQEDDGVPLILTSSPIVLEIYYNKPARAIDLQWATTKFIEANLPNSTSITDLSPQLQEKISTFNALYKNIHIGDRYTLQYIPNIGIQLLLNDELLGVVGDDIPLEEQQELAQIIYSVWFGKVSPFSESMRKELLTPLITEEEESLQHPVTFNKESAPILATDSRQDSSSHTTTMTEEERKLLNSMGLLQFLHEEEKESITATKSSQMVQQQTAISSNTQDKNSNAISTGPSYSLSSVRSRIRNSFVSPKNKGDDTMQYELEGQDHNSEEDDSEKDITTEEYKYNPILLGIGGTLFLFPHLAVLLSLPPVLKRRGAPYLPTFGNKLNHMFDIIRHHTLHSRYMQQKKKAKQSLQFVDLGSGDGRVVFRAAREGLFDKSVGYEINPVLHLFANFRRLATPKYWSNTQFYMRDLWKIQLHQYDVVAVYGLAPIMERLGKKLEKELPNGAIVVSNVFSIPGWKVSDTKNGTKGSGVYLYQVPDCFRRSKSKDKGAD